MDELAYALSGENAHYGTPINTAAPGRVPGGSTSGPAVSLSWIAGCGLRACMLTFYMHAHASYIMHAMLLLLPYPYRCLPPLTCK